MTEQWSYVIAAYAVTAIAVLGLLLQSYWAMRRAEMRAEADKNTQKNTPEIPQ